MTPLDPVPPRRPSGSRRALRVGLLVVLVAVAVGGLAFAASSLQYLWGGHGHEEDLPPGAGRTVRHFFEVEDEAAIASLEAELDIALGTVRVARAEAGALFQAEVDLTSDRLRPRFEGETAGSHARVELSLGGENVSLTGLRATRGNVWRLYLSERVPLALDLNLGAAEADLDLTGVPLSRLALDCGMAKAAIRFDAANPVVMASLDIEAGLSNFEAHGLGHARFRRLDFSGGAGDFTLDFSGDTFEPGAAADVSVGMASLTLVLPQGHPVVLDAPTSFMTHVEVPPALVALGKGRWATPGADGDAHALRIDVEAGPGSVRVRLVE